MGGKLDQVLQYLSPQPAASQASDADRDIARALGIIP